MPDAIELAVAHKRQHPADSYRTVSKRFKVAPTTLHDRVTNHHQSHEEGAVRNLSIEQEKQLVAKVLEYADRGTLLTPSQIRQFAELISGKHVGHNWTCRFLKRYSNELDSKIYGYTEQSRKEADVYETRRAFYELVKKALDTHLYPPSCLYNMDETPFNLCFERKCRKVGPLGHPRNGQAIPNSGEHITVLATIGTSSAPVPPLVIFSGQGIEHNWTAEHIPGLTQKADVTDSGYVVELPSFST